ncbi:MAG: membrane protein insertion efficiency factor YidD [Chlorobiaceae bacterium]
MYSWKFFNQVPIILIKFYQSFLSPLFGPSCKFVPTCSSYALEAFRQHNFFYASWLTLWRILRCNPFSKGGFDPVPSVSLNKKKFSGKIKESGNG